MALTGFGMRGMNLMCRRCSKAFQYYNRSCVCLSFNWNNNVSYLDQKRYYSHLPVTTYTYPDIQTEEAARSFIVNLDGAGRSLILEQLKKYESTKEEMKNSGTSEPATISVHQLWDVFLFNGIPFIGFGLLDNLVMILAGEYIDVTFGAMLGISTMAAAALGNLVSDMAGVGCAGYVEALSSKLGIRFPDITPAQAMLQSTRWCAGTARAIGVAVGCFLGMFPLLFYKDDKKQKSDCEDKEKTQ